MESVLNLLGAIIGTLGAFALFLLICWVALMAYYVAASPFIAGWALIQRLRSK